MKENSFTPRTQIKYQFSFCRFEGYSRCITSRKKKMDHFQNHYKPWWENFNSFIFMEQQNIIFLANNENCLSLTVNVISLSNYFKQRTGCITAVLKQNENSMWENMKTVLVR